MPPNKPLQLTKPALPIESSTIYRTVVLRCDLKRWASQLSARALGRRLQTETAMPVTQGLQWRLTS
jgi:hypothetical protein